jgi:uncharacterized cupredoxin-like copper-binding protein
MRRLAIRALLPIALLAVLATACGDNEPTVPSAATTPPASGPQKPAGGGALPEPSPECKPYGNASKADKTVDVRLQEWAVIPAVAEAEVRPGSETIHFKLNNVGKEAHEFVVATGDDPNKLPTDADGAAILPKERFVGEIERFPAGETCDLTVDFTPGKYVLFCNVVETEESGEKESHYKLGMRTGFTVTG